MRQHDGGVHIEHDRAVADIPARRPCRRHRAQQRPHPGADPRPCLGDPPQLDLADLVQRPPAGRRRGHRAEHLPLVTQHVDVADRLTTVGDHHRQIDRDPAPIMARPPTPPGQRTRQRLGQAGPIRQHSQQRRTHMRHHPRAIRGDPQTSRPRRRLHLRSAPSARDPVRFDTDSFPCRRGTSAYLHADNQHMLMITANHPG
jgi:hypothetical protein